LQTLNPNLSNEWNYKKNIGLTPADVSHGSSRKVWWQCSKGHEWQTTIAHRSKGQNCPYCSNKKVLSGYNDLKTVNPSLSNEWNYDKNGGLTPMDVLPNTHKQVWWKCSKGHEWQATVAHRNNGTGCPYCSGRKKL
jgi:DNA-directed RNA polymerase subunit RPC12/RpoP